MQSGGGVGAGESPLHSTEPSIIANLIYSEPNKSFLAA